MKAKALELRDSCTFIPILCVNMQPENEGQRYLLRRCGYPLIPRHPNIMLTRLEGNGSPARTDPDCWGDRTFVIAHEYITKHWTELKDGDVVDVEFILGKTTAPKLSERLSYSID